MNHLLKDYVSIIEFARIKNVYPNTVYDAIKKGDITIELIGKAKLKWIDLSKHAGYTPAKKQPNLRKLKAWYKRTRRPLSEK